ncbi:hypothetical protein, partial [Campylobacter sp.]|uniref:hypothetical protein n=1 Tax=Campylobacter sp. TaxID=205 RepID=UPI0026DC85E8
MPSLVLEKNLSALQDLRLRGALVSLRTSRWRAIFTLEGVNFEGGGGRLVDKDISREKEALSALYYSKYT